MRQSPTRHASKRRHRSRKKQNKRHETGQPPHASIISTNAAFPLYPLPLPSDNLQQPVDKIAAAQFTDLLAPLATRIADAPTRPAWYPESSFSIAGN